MQFYWTVMCIVAPFAWLASGGTVVAPFQEAASTAAVSNPLSRRQSNSLNQDCGLRTGHPSFKLSENSNWNNNRTAKVIGGVPTQHGAYPWQVQILVKRRGILRHLCGGAIISQYHVLTAAHCLRDHPKHVYRIKVGKHRLDRIEASEEIFFIRDFIRHPRYQKEGYYSNDIAIIKVIPKNSRGFIFGQFVQPICLPPSEDNLDGGITTEPMFCTVTGWGLQIQTNKLSMSTVLLEASVRVFSQEICRSKFAYGGSSQAILPGMLCAGVLGGGADACGGDSGGPLSCLVNGRFYVYGIVSWGDGCGLPLKPGIYSRVSYYKKWIERWIQSPI